MYCLKKSMVLNNFLKYSLYLQYGGVIGNEDKPECFQWIL